MKKIAVLRKGDFYIYAYDLIVELSNNNFDVTAIVCIDKIEENVIYDDLLYKVNKIVKLVRLRDISKRFTLRIKTLLNKFRFSLNQLIVSPWLIYKTVRKFQDEEYDFIIAVGQESLYWAYKSFKKNKDKIIYYNLEIIYKNHPITKDPTWKRIVSFENKVLNKIGGVIIQDRFRAEILLRDFKNFQQNKIIYFPVCINEKIVIKKGNYLIDKFSLSSTDIVVLYFGGLWQGRFLNEIIDNSSSLNAKIKIVIHGGRGSISIKSNNPNVIISNEKLLFHEVTELVSSAHIGLAFYPKDNYNDQYSAYSSEKISRYCQCGIPFVAFENENYLYFKKQHDCCVLIENIRELGAAINNINNNYKYYQKNAFNAFENNFDYKKQLKNIINFLNTRN